MAKMTFEEWRDEYTKKHGPNVGAQEGWDACAAEYEHELSALRKMGPCGKHPKAFWRRDLHIAGSRPFGVDKCVPDEHWHEFCTLCAEQSAREAALLEKAAQVKMGGYNLHGEIEYSGLPQWAKDAIRALKTDSALDDLLREARLEEAETLPNHSRYCVAGIGPVKLDPNCPRCMRLAELRSAPRTEGK